jgi:hypothetical protein
MRLEARSLALALAAVACAIAAIVAAACIVIPPPDPPMEPLRSPRILHASVVPPEGVPLGDGPWDFTIPVEVDSRIPAFQYEAFVDEPNGGGGSGEVSLATVNVSPSALDGGVMLLQVNLDLQQQRYDPGVCHRIEVMVAVNFPQPHFPDNNGSDSIFWLYEGSGAPYGCPTYDAGPYQDGFFPPADASDSLFIIPTESGVDP